MSCLVCSKPSTHETECCGRVYCGDSCLASDLSNHDLMCIEATNPIEWVRLMRQDMIKPILTVPLVAKPDEIILFVYKRKETRDQRFKTYMKAVRKTEYILTKGSDQILKLQTEAALNRIVRTRGNEGYWFIRSN